jgi:2-C-methyl-D-erythritol 4-phosphate cytidylyltransferase/2-C-methyl-D-erythritol 2,4-cyclodiphosphate synthase
MASSSIFGRTPFAAVIVAAGKGLRAGQPLPKQFAPWRGKTVLWHAVRSLHAAGAAPIVVAVPDGGMDLAADRLVDFPEVRFVTGGETRQASVALALEALVDDAPARVLIHDAARPDCPPEVIDRLLAALDTAPGAIPVLPVVDSVVRADGDRMGTAEQRDQLRRVQTPQAFRFPEILAAHRAWFEAPLAGDDAQVMAALGAVVHLVEGSEALGKLTFSEDFMPRRTAIVPFRTGTGFDVHRLAAGEDLWLCGIKVPHDKGLLGHSDSDVGLHALVDAILGAVGAGDIGQHFPPSDPQWRGAPSSRFLEHAVSLAAERGYVIGNVDITLICEAPKIGPYRDAMQLRIAELLEVDPDRVSVKATTTERLGFTGRGEGIAAQAIATLIAETLS